MGKVKVKRKTPAGKIKIVEKRKKPKIAKCAICKSPLHGIPRKIPSGMRKLALSEKRPNRPYGGYLCSRCMRELLKEKVRELK
jgi:large subunit ribosomal protein L34e